MAFLTRFFERFLTPEVSVTAHSSPQELPKVEDIKRPAQHHNHDVSFDDLLRAMGADL
ncbi:hypothetical protein [Deinococcus irradiatisoli]|uniref:hypothetical protein n=1 Tax=Deinococcus irradiatisoli TaxID=2202254 RepID=UPI0015E84BF2|nr:hypothetical protein [Deinococcus irradiatisoli]